ncbi:MAG: hydantoinase/oxoprolinase family protein [Planctomycetota bacterium]
MIPSPGSSPKPVAYRVGVDTGGTFTDLVLTDPSGLVVETHKRLSTPDDPARAVLAGIDELLAKAGRPPRGVEPVDVVHGSTVATNALLERDDARVAFVTTAGFEDTLRLARQHRPGLYDLVPRRAEPLVPPERCVGVRERMRHDGGVIEPLTAAEAERVIGVIEAMGVEAVAVSLLHSYANAEHERRLGEAIAERFGNGVHVTLSYELLPEFREYERASTCVVNAVVAPRMRRYLERLSDELGSHRLRVMASHGGTVTVADAVREPVRMILSGPAGGVRGAAGPVSGGGGETSITLDMGGTSTDVALLVAGEPTRSSEHEAGGVPVGLPMVDLHTVGAGGGSIAWLDDGGALRVGPRSAGADPGPACYGKQAAGAESVVTVTDAHVVLGHLPDGFPLGDGLRVQCAPAAAAVGRLAARAGMAADELARGVLSIAELHMARAVQRVTLQRGRDPRSATLVPFGGAGGLHACGVADRLGITRVRVPVNPGLLSAVGMLDAPLRQVSTLSLHRSIPAGESEPDLAETFGRLHELRPDMETRGVVAEDYTYEVAFRYAGQSHELTFTLDEAADAGRGGNLAAYFHELHERVYGHADRGRPIELVLVRRWTDAWTDADESSYEVHYATHRSNQPGTPNKGFIDRRELAVGQALRGPVTVTEYSATTRVVAGWTLTVAEGGALMLERDDGA